MCSFRGILTVLVLAAAAAFSANPARGQVVISQIYGGTGGFDSTYTADYIELFNRGPLAVNLSGWSVQYASTIGRNWSKTDLSGSIAPGGYFLIQELAGAGNFDLPIPDVFGAINLGITNGKIALVANQTVLPSTGYFAPGVNGVVDFVGYGAPTSDIYGYEGNGPSGQNLSTTTAALRKDGGCTDTNDNSADFDPAGNPNPRNSASPTNACADISVSGACCLTNGTCTYATSSTCAAASGTYRGDYVPCAVGSYTLTSNSAALIDISSTGDNITGAGGDGFVNPPISSAPFALPFPVNYYGQTSTVFRVDSNGWMTLASSDGTSSGSNPTNWPGFVAPLAALAPYWDDLTTASGTGAHIYSQTNGTAPNRQFIVQFDKLPGATGSGTGSNTSQVIINESSQVIEFRYGTIIANGDTYPGGTRVASFSAGIKDLSSAFSVDANAASLGTGGPAAARQFTPIGQCPTTGACCRTGLCFPATSLSCLVGAGIYSGDGVACTASACLTGACCLQNGTCNIQNPGQCTAVNSGVYQGNSSVCGTVPCPFTGSCCAGIACTVTFGPMNGQCAAGTWSKDGSCGTNLCAGSCCNPITNACTLVVNAASCGAGNAFHPLGTTCTTDPCPAPVNDNCAGAIAIPTSALGMTILGGNGSAAQSNESAPTCQGQSILFRGVWYAFTPTNSHRYEATTCSALTTYDTSLFVYSGSCDADPLTSLICVGGNLSTFPTPCPIRSDAATFAWCATPMTTYYILVTGSGNLFGAFGLTINDLGVSDTCPGACCTGTACSITSGSTACISGGGVFQGAATTCPSDNMCILTATLCCRGATCAVLAPADCTVTAGAKAGITSPSAASCNVPGNRTTPCCYANYNKSASGITVQDIFDFLSDWFAGQKYAVVGGDGATGNLTVQSIFDFLNAWFAGGCS